MLVTCTSENCAKVHTRWSMLLTCIIIAQYQEPKCLSYPCECDVKETQLMNSIKRSSESFRKDFVILPFFWLFAHKY